MPEEPVILDQKPKRGRRKAQIREVLSIAIWGLAFIQLFVFDIFKLIVESAGLPLWVYQFRLYLVGAFLVSSSLVLGHKRFLKNIGYIVFYPFVVVLWKIPKFLFLNWPLLVAFAPAIHSFGSRLRSRLAAMIVAAIAATIILLSDVYPLLLGSVCVIGLLLLFYFYGQMKSVFSSETIFSKAAGFVNRMWEKTKSGDGFVPPAEVDMETEEGREKFGTPLLQSYGMTIVQTHVATKLQEISESRKLDGYLIISWIWTVCVTVFSFALIYLGFSKMDPSSFNEQSDFWGFVGYSICVLTTSGLSGIEAVSQPAKVVSYIELTGTVFILVLMVFIVLTSQRDKFKKDLRKVSEELEQSALKFEGAMTENFDLTVAAAEKWLLRNNKGSEFYMKLKYSEEEMKKISEEAESTVDV